MKVFKFTAALSFSLILGSCTSLTKQSSRTPQGTSEPQRFAHFMHIDGLRPDVFEKMLNAGQLPHLQFLRSRGKVSFKTATVDKTETMKVIQSYLTSYHDTEVTGWWQFNRDEKSFFNCDTNPVGILHYSLGLTFPKYPTMLDVVASDNKSVAVGFGLHRRSVPFENYSRNYVAAAGGVLHKEYFNQANATMTSFTNMLLRMARNPQEKLPTLSTSLLAPFDEYAHWKGIVATKNDPHHKWKTADVACFNRKPIGDKSRDYHEAFFELWDKESDIQTIVGAYRESYFESIEEDSNGRVIQLCIRVPDIEAYAESTSTNSASINLCSKVSNAHPLGPKSTCKVTPEVALGLIMVDMQVGRLIHSMRQIRLNSDGTKSVDLTTSPSLAEYLAKNRPEGSMFENTLFAFMGDHGFGDTKHTTSMKDEKGHPDPYSHPDSNGVSFIQSLASPLNLKVIEGDLPGNDSTEIAMDDTLQPTQIKYLYKDPKWINKSPVIAAKVAEAKDWGWKLSGELTRLLGQPAIKKIPALEDLGALLAANGIVPGARVTTNSKALAGAELLTHLYLLGDPEYVQEELKEKLLYYDKHVRLIYGGAARSNAEIFIPGKKAGKYSWAVRPSDEERETFKGSLTSQTTLLATLQKNPATGLIFLRRGLKDFTLAQELPAVMQIDVIDRKNNRGIISVSRDTATQKLVFHYARVTQEDPLALGKHSLGAGHRATYQDWNDLGIREKFYYLNVVGGMGTYLYSLNPHIGDISVMRGQGWNFGDNAGSHGGVHAEEKLTALLISGPGINPGELFAESKYTYDKNGKVEKLNTRAYPTALDMAPTVLNWLGYGPNALENFARAGFRGHFENWVKKQRQDVVDHILPPSLPQELKTIGYSDADTEALRSKLHRLFQFMPDHPGDLKKLKTHKTDGVLLNLE